MLKEENKILKRKMESMMDLQMDYFTHLKDFEDTSNNLKILISKNSLIEADRNFIKKCYCEKEEKLNNIENKLELLKSKKESFNVRNLNKKIKYRDTQLEIKKNKINSLKNEEKKIILQLKNKITDINSILENSDINISELKNKKVKLQKKVSNLKIILQNKTNYINDNNMKGVISLEKEVVSLYSKTNILKEENLELQKLVSLLDDDEVITFEDGRYSDDIRETIMKLLSMNVSMNSVNEVIKVVLNKLAKKNISRLPSAAVKCRLMQEASILDQFQVAEAMLENNLINKNPKIGNCLHGDGTQKYHKHYQNFQITTTSGKTLSFGLSEVVGKDAATRRVGLTRF
ncbi:centromere-associated protein E-like [Hydra vulgaris]|uniref:centromere-associated protein E-like n=1 Tax=Hydra vulgaris TaxID=6087 RepID=UPI001F5F692A|nr:centromere-associated protein E-like [Hydra vulgaris]